MKLLLLIPDGVGIRNYLYSDVLKYCKERDIQVAVLHKLDNAVIQEAEKLHNITLESYELVLTEQSFLIRLIRESTTYARLRINAKKVNNPTILTNWKTGRGSIKLKLLYFFANLFGTCLNTYSQVEAVEKLMFGLESNKAKQYYKIFEEIKPDVLFCTHQRVAEISPFMIAARQMGIKTATAIFSWDNLPKARLPIRCDKYFVWSEYMKRELMTYYPEIVESSIDVTGTPQFDFYKKSELIESRDGFAARYGLDPLKKWVLFTGDDKTTSPYDALYLRDLAEALQDEKNIQLLFREVPVENTLRYSEILKSFPIKHVKPLWIKSELWSFSYPLFDDVAMLVNLAYHCSVVVNVGSTLAHDFAQFNNPALYINYDQDNSVNWSVNTIYSFQHFRSMTDKSAVGWINNREEIKEKVMTAIHSPEEIAQKRMKWMETIIGVNDNLSAELLVKDLLKTMSK